MPSLNAQTGWYSVALKKYLLSTPDACINDHIDDIFNGMTAGGPGVAFESPRNRHDRGQPPYPYHRLRRKHLEGWKCTLRIRRLRDR